MNKRDIIAAKLESRFSPDFLEVVDESAHHQGHAGWREKGETHYRVRIAARHFAGLSRIAQHRAVMETLDAELKGGVHALAIEIVGATGPNRPADPA